MHRQMQMHRKKRKKMEKMNEERKIYFLDKASVGNFSAREKKLVSEVLSSCFDRMNNVGYIDIYGGLGNGFWDSSISYTEISAKLEAFMQDEDIQSVVLLINSPGGMAEGLLDCCNYIRECATKKPINAYITGMACSAAYAIAVSCNKVYGIADGTTGCCGCYAEALEIKEETYEKMGFLHRIFRSANAPKKNLSVITDKEASEEYQAFITATGDQYLEYVASCRGIDKETAEKTFGRGAVVTNEYAVESGMIDGICSIERFIELTCSVPTDESEGEDMDITTMSAEEQKEVFDALCSANPSLLNERMDAVRQAEKDRVEGLNALRDGSGEVDAIVDAAVKDGRTAEAIGLDVIKAMKANAGKAKEEAKAALLESLAEDTTTVATPSAEKSETEVIDDLASRI